MTRTDLETVRRYIAAWDLVHDQPLSTPGPDDLSKATGESKQHTKELLDAERLVSATITDLWKTEKCSPVWMSKLIIHVYRHGLPIEAFRLYEDPTKGVVPLGLVALGFDAETLVKARLLMFRQRLLAKIDAQLSMAS